MLEEIFGDRCFGRALGFVSLVVGMDGLDEEVDAMVILFVLAFLESFVFAAGVGWLMIPYSWTADSKGLGQRS